MRCLEGKDFTPEPIKELEVIGKAPEQSLAEVNMSLDEPREDDKSAGIENGV
jgi:hypothetical protein